MMETSVSASLRADKNAALVRLPPWLRQGIKRIAREQGIARDTVRKALRSGATEFTYKH